MKKCYTQILLTLLFKLFLFIQPSVYLSIEEVFDSIRVFIQNDFLFPDISIFNSLFHLIQYTLW